MLTLESLKSEFDDLRDALQIAASAREIKEQFRSLQRGIAESWSDTTTVRSGVGAIRLQVLSLQRDVEQLKSEVASSAPNATEVDSLLDKMARCLDRMDRRMTPVYERLDVMEYQQDGVTRNFAAIMRHLGIDPV
jgi:hypothetical protein